MYRPGKLDGDNRPLELSGVEEAQDIVMTGETAQEMLDRLLSNQESFKPAAGSIARERRIHRRFKKRRSVCVGNSSS